MGHMAHVKEMKVAYVVLVETSKKDNLEGVGIDGTIILKHLKN
jgi:hypothetical protein